MYCVNSKVVMGKIFKGKLFSENMADKPIELEDTSVGGIILSGSSGSSTGEFPQGTSYAVYCGRDKGTGLYVFQFMTEDGNSGFKRIEYGFEHHEMSHIFRDLKDDSSWTRHEYFERRPKMRSEIMGRINGKTAQVVGWNRDALDRWEGDLRITDELDSRVYEKGHQKDRSSSGSGSRVAM